MRSLLCFATLFCCITCFAQTADESYLNQIDRSTIGPSNSEDVSQVTLKSFNRQYKSASDVVWNTSKQGASVKFTLDGINYRVFYNKKGRWKSTIKYIPVELLPKHVVSRIKLDYPDYTIFFGQYVRTVAGHAYIVSVEKKNSWKQIKLVGNEIEVMGDYVRNNF